jgi:hypothetical protein
MSWTTATAVMVGTENAARPRKKPEVRPSQPVESVSLLDCAGRRRSPRRSPAFTKAVHRATTRSATQPTHPPSEIIAVVRAAGDSPEGVRLRGVIVVLWRAGLRISEALALAETDLDRHGGALVIRAGKGGKRREVEMDRWVGKVSSPGSSSAPISRRRAVPCSVRPRSGRTCEAGRWRLLCSSRRPLLRRTALATLRSFDPAQRIPERAGQCQSSRLSSRRTDRPLDLFGSEPCTGPDAAMDKMSE